MGIPLTENLFSAWVTVLSKRHYVAEDMNAFNDKLHKIEDYLKAHSNSSGSPFAYGSENPSQLDIHLYACLSRPYFTKDSVFHDTLWTKMAFDKSPNVMKLLESMRARPEFQPVLSHHKTH